MNTKTPLSDLLQKEVTRKQFLVLLGSAAVGVMGLSTIIHFLTGKKVGIKHLQTKGFGSGPYGI